MMKILLVLTTIALGCGTKTADPTMRATAQQPVNERYCPLAQQPSDPTPADKSYIWIDGSGVLQVNSGSGSSPVTYGPIKLNSALNANDQAITGAASISQNDGSTWSSGSGSPNGVVTGSPGDLYTSVGGGSGTTLYVKESGSATNTGWVGK
jgi:hypothetical protein